MLYIMRHGTTDWNVARKLQGGTDIPLNGQGRTKAREAAKRYADVHFDLCYCSPLSRAKETAEILLEGRGVQIICDDRLTEMRFGVCEGEEDSFPAKDGPMKAFFAAPQDYIPPKGAESFAQLFSRTGEILEQVILPLVKSGKDVLIVGHGAMNCQGPAARKILERGLRKL